MAEYVMKNLVKKAAMGHLFHIASAATSREEIGNPVYPPAQKKLNATRISNFFIEIRVAFCRKILIYQGFPVFAFWRSHRANVKIVKLFSFIKVAI